MAVRLSFSSRLAALSFAVILVSTGVMLGFLHLASQRSLDAGEASLIRELREDLLVSYGEGGAQGLAEAIQDRLQIDPHTTAIIAYVAPSGTVVVGNVVKWPARAGAGPEFTAVRRSGDPVALPARIERVALGDGSVLIVGQVRTGVLALRASDRSGLILALAISVPLSLALAFLLVRVIEGRARQIAEVAERVGRGELASRIEVAGSRDAFDRLAAALNDAFARIDALVGELRTVTDGLAHDLRSPITRLAVAIDDAQRATEDPATRAALDRAALETAGLESILGTALQITRLEAGIGRDRFVRLDMAWLLEELADLFGPAAEDAGFVLEVNAPRQLVLSGHRQLIAQAVGNLLDNAIHYAVGGTSITLAASRADNGQVLVTVADDGPGIAPERRAEALRRFGRLDPARHEPGSGLGLSLVAATAALHGGRLELDDAAPGLLARLTLGEAEMTVPES